MDLRGLYSEPKTVTRRQLVAWLRHLPSDSALARRGLAGDKHSDQNEILQVSMINELRLANYYYVRSHSSGDVDEPTLLEIENEEAK